MEIIIIIIIRCSIKMIPFINTCPIKFIIFLYALMLAKPIDPTHLNPISKQSRSRQRSTIHNLVGHYFLGGFW